VVAAASILDSLPTPSFDEVGKVYQQLKDILSTIEVQQAKSSLYCWGKVSILTLGCFKAGGQRAAQETPEVVMVSSPAQIHAHD
jgi:hypothetical protein